MTKKARKLSKNNSRAASDMSERGGNSISQHTRLLGSEEYSMKYYRKNGQYLTFDSLGSLDMIC